MAESPSNTSEQPAAKRRRIKEPNTCLQELPADRFASRIYLFGGDQVTVRVGGKEFKIAKALLCYHSTYFDAAFNGGFKETVEQELTMSPEHTAETFELVIQWIYSGKIIIPDRLQQAKTDLLAIHEDIAAKKKAKVSTKDLKTQKSKIEEEIKQIKQAQVGKYIAFLRMADEIDLLGPTHKIIQEISTIFLSNRNNLSAEHIRSAADLPRKHPLRSLVAKACVGDFIYSTLNDRFHNQSKTFKFATELKELEGFSHDLMQIYLEALNARNTDKEGDIYVVDPFDKNVKIWILEG